MDARPEGRTHTLNVGLYGHVYYVPRRIMLRSRGTFVTVNFIAIVMMIWRCNCPVHVHLRGLLDTLVAFYYAPINAG